MEEKIRTYLQDKIDQNRLESALLQVSKKDEIILEEAVGTSTDTVFDVGALIDVVAILPAILKLVERRRKKLALNHKVAQYIPEFAANGKEDVQIMNLLTHTSGLPSYKIDRLEDIFQAELEFPPGSKVAYSTHNFMLLPQIFEQVAETTLENFLKDFILDPLRMNHTELVREDDGRYRLYSTLSDLNRFSTMVEQGGTYDYLRIIKKKAIDLSKQNFTSFLNENRGLGWKLDDENKTYGYCEANTGLWFIPEKKLKIMFHVKLFENHDSVNKILEDIYPLISEGQVQNLV